MVKDHVSFRSQTEGLTTAEPRNPNPSAHISKHYSLAEVEKYTFSEQDQPQLLPLKSADAN